MSVAKFCEVCTSYLANLNFTNYRLLFTSESVFCHLMFLFVGPESAGVLATLNRHM